MKPMARKPHDPLDTIEGIFYLLIFLAIAAVVTGIVR
jgi:hypothetical protein